MDVEAVLMLLDVSQDVILLNRRKLTSLNWSLEQQPRERSFK